MMIKQVKPDRKIFYDYYDIITNPISFKEIIYKLKRRLYTDINAFESDFALFCYGNMTSCKEGDALQCSKNNALFRTT